MNRIIIGIVVFIIIIIGILFYLRSSCSSGKYFSLSKFKCLECKSCPLNKWYNPEKSCKGFSDKKCLNFSTPLCDPGKRVVRGNEKRDNYCELISKCFKTCDDGEYVTDLHLCGNIRGGSASCATCKECSEDEIDIKDENCMGRQVSNISGVTMYTKLIDGRNQWVPMSCEDDQNRVCLNNNYIKFNTDIDYNIVMFSQNQDILNCVSSISFTGSDNNYYSNSNKPSIIDVINDNARWGKLSILDLKNSDTINSQKDSCKWKIKASLLNTDTYNNCPIESNDLIYFYRNFSPTEDSVLTIIKSIENGEEQYNIGCIIVPINQHRFSKLTNIRNNIYKDFKIQDFNNFKDNILISNTKTREKFFKLQATNRNKEATGVFLGFKYLSSSQQYIIKAYHESEINSGNRNFTRINFQKIK